MLEPLVCDATLKKSTTQWNTTKNIVGHNLVGVALKFINNRVGESESERASV